MPCRSWTKSSHRLSRLPVVDRRFQEQEQEQEQEKEEVVMDDDPEEYVQMKYSRDDEVPKGWAIRDLSTPLASKLGFYPASDFGVLTKLIQQVTRDFCFVSFLFVKVWC